MKRDYWAAENFLYEKVSEAPHGDGTAIRHAQSARNHSGDDAEIRLHHFGS